MTKVLLVLKVCTLHYGMIIESNVLLTFPMPIRKILITEVTNFLYQSSNMAGMSGNSSSMASTPTTLANSLAASNLGSGGSAAYTVSAITPTGMGVDGIASLTTMFHVRWIMEIIGQAFTLPLEDISVVSNATAIYIQWLVEPAKRPLAIQKADSETQQQFLQTIFRNVSLLFQPKKVDGVGAAKPLLATLASKHVELCKLMLRTLAQVAIASGAPACEDSMMATAYSTATWKVLLRVLLGVCDYLLRMPTQPYCYLAEELGEQLLSIFMELWLRSQIFSASMWKALKALYPRWTLRMLAITQWSAVSLALTQRVTKILYGQGTNAIVYTVHANLVTLELSGQYSVYAWHQILHLIGSPTNLAPAIFFRSVLGMEKLVQVFHSIGSTTGDCTGAVERYFPDGNTMLHLFGTWLFEAVSQAAPDCAEGRAQAFGVLCRIFARPQLRSPFLATYLHQFYAAIIEGLKADLLSLVFIVVNCEDIFALSLPGVRILVAPFVSALRRLIPHLEKPLRVSLNMDDLRRACYKLLCTMFGFCKHFSLATTKDLIMNPSNNTFGNLENSPIAQPIDASASPQKSMEPSGIDLISRSPSNLSMKTSLHELSSKLYAVYFPQTSESFSNEFLTLGQVRYWIMDILIAAFLVEQDPGNLRYLINALTAFSMDDAPGTPGLMALVLGLFEEQIFSAKWPVDVCIVAIEALRQFVSFENIIKASNDSAPQSLVITLCTMVQTLIAKNNLPVFLKPILALFDCIIDWVLGPEATSSWFSNDPECQGAVIKMFTKALVYGNSIAKKVEGHSESSPATVTTPGSTSRLSLTKTPASPAASFSLISTKSLEGQLATAAEIALSRLLQYFATGLTNPFSPTHLSSLLNECHLVEGFGHAPLDYIAGKPKKLSSLNREQIQSLRYFILNDSTIVCFVERPIEAGLKKGHLNNETSELVVLARSVTGRFSWESSLLYTLDPKRYEKLVKHSIGEDPTSEFEYNPIHGSLDNFGYENIFADSLKRQLMVTEEHSGLKAFPVHLNQIGPVFNEDFIQSRFACDDKRLLNYNCIKNLAKEQIVKARGVLVNNGASLRNYRARPPIPIHPKQQYARLFLGHLGLTSLKSREAAVRLPNCVELLSDLEILDSLPERETISCSVFFVKSGRQSLAEILTNDKVSTDYIEFVHSLGWCVDLGKHAGWSGGSGSVGGSGGNLTQDVASYMPYYANNDVEMIFNVPAFLKNEALCSSSVSLGGSSSIEEDQMPAHTSGLYRIISNDLVTILWLEDLQEMLTLPSKFQTRSIVYICISPLADSELSAGLYRIRIMVTSLASVAVSSTANGGATFSSSSASSSPNQSTSGEAVFLFGPLLDGMIVRRESLGRLVRETAISACLFCLYNIQNQPRPMVKRSQFIQHMINKYRLMTPTPAKYYNELIYNTGM